MALFTISEFKEAEGIGVATYDALLTNLANRATTALNRYARRILEATDYTEELDGTGCPRVIVANSPINSVTSLKVTSDRDFTITAVDPTTYVFDRSGVITLLPTAQLTILALTNQAIFWKGIRNVQVVYNGGFAAVPEDVKHAAILLASSWMVRARKGGVQSSTLGSETISFQSHRWPAEVRALMDPYRQMFMPTGWDN